MEKLERSSIDWRYYGAYHHPVRRACSSAAVHAGWTRPLLVHPAPSELCTVALNISTVLDDPHFPQSEVRREEVSPIMKVKSPAVSKWNVPLVCCAGLCFAGAVLSFAAFWFVVSSNVVLVLGYTATFLSGAFLLVSLPADNWVARTITRFAGRQSVASGGGEGK